MLCTDQGQLSALAHHAGIPACEDAHRLLFVVARNGLMRHRADERLHEAAPEIPALLIRAAGGVGEGSVVAVIGAESEGWRMVVCAVISEGIDTELRTVKFVPCIQSF